MSIPARPAVVVTRRRTERRVVVALLSIIILAIIAADAFVLLKRFRYQAESDRLRNGMTSIERERTDLLLASTEKRSQVMVELIRRQAGGDENLHLAVAVDSGFMHLQRDGARLRDMPIQVGAERVLGAMSAGDSLHLAIPRGTRTIERIITARDSWVVPELVYRDREEELPPLAERRIRGALGPYALILSGGTVIYSLPETGPLADSTYVLPAAIRANAADLQAVFPNLRAGMRVYFY